MQSIIDSHGVERFLGNQIPATSHTKYMWTELGDDSQSPEPLPQDKWRECDYSEFVSPNKDQDGIGACNAFDTVYLAEFCRRLAGEPNVPLLSPGYLYGNINGQQDRGSLLEDALAWMIKYGTCLESTVPPLNWKKSQWPANAAVEAKDNRILEAWLCPTVNHLAAAIMSGFGLSLGIMWSDGDKTDADGWLPERTRGNVGGHAIMGCGLVKRGGQWGFKFKQSWNPDWGKNGFGVIPIPRFSGPVGGWWAARSATQKGIV